MTDVSPIRTTTPQDAPVIYEILRRQNKEAYMIRNERAWRTISEMLCEDNGYHLSTVYQAGSVVVGFNSVITDPGRFWQLFIKRYGPFRFLAEKFRQKFGHIREKNKETAPLIKDHPIDREFLARSRKRYETVPGRVNAYYVYIDPEARKGGMAFELSLDMGDRLRSLGGFQTVEFEILVENDISRKLHEAIGCDVRSIGEMWYVVAYL